MEGEDGRKQTRGRQKIPMQLIQNQEDLYASFSKRRVGLFKKATELCTLCDVDVGIIMFSPTDVPYSFFHPSMESVVSRSLNPDRPQTDMERATDSHINERIVGMNRELDSILAAKDAERVRFQRNMDEIKTRNIWMRQPLNTLTREQALVWRAWFREYKVRIARRIEQIKNEAEASQMASLPPPEAGENVEDLVIACGAALPGDDVFQPDQMPPGQFYYPGQMANDPKFGGGGPSTQFYYPPSAAPPPAPPLEGQNLFDGSLAPFPDSFLGPSDQDLHLGPPGDGPSYNPCYAPPPQLDFSAAGGDYPGQFYDPSQPLDFSAAGGADEVVQFYDPSQPFDFSPAGGADEASQFYFPQAPHDPASGGAPNPDEAGQFYFPPPPYDPVSGGASNIDEDGQFYLPPPPYDPASGGAPNLDEAGPFYLPPPPYDPASGGAPHQDPGQFFLPTLPYDPDSGGEHHQDETDQFYFPPPHEPASGGPHNQDEAGPSHQNYDDA